MPKPIVASAKKHCLKRWNNEEGLATAAKIQRIFQQLQLMFHNDMKARSGHS